MAYTNETTHYGIPLPLGSDLTTPMDYNESMQDVDTALFESKTDSSSALQKANQLQQDLATTNDNVTAVTGRVTTLEGTVTTQGQSILQNTRDISDVRADALDMIVAKDEGTAQVATVAVAKGEYFRYNDVLYIATQAIAVGDTIVPNTNCKATNVGTELNQLNNDLGDKSTASSVSGNDAFSKINALHNAISKGYVEVSGNGAKTYATLLNELYALADFSKISSTSKFEIINSTDYTYTYMSITGLSTNQIQFSVAMVTGDGEYVGFNTLKSTGSTAVAGRLNTMVDISNTVPSATQKYRILY